MICDAEAIFRKALQAVEVQRAVQTQIHFERGVLALGDSRFSRLHRRMVIVAVGKAGAPMYEAAAGTPVVAGW